MICTSYLYNVNYFKMFLVLLVVIKSLHFGKKNNKKFILQDLINFFSDFIIISASKNEVFFIFYYCTLNIQLMLNDPWIYNQPLTCTKAITMLYSSVSTSQGMPMLCSTVRYFLFFIVVVQTFAWPFRNNEGWQTFYKYNIYLHMYTY